MGDYVVPADHVIVANHVLRQGYAGSVGAEGLAEDVDRPLDRMNKVRTAAGSCDAGPSEEGVDVRGELGVVLEEEPVGGVGVDLDPRVRDEARQ